MKTFKIILVLGFTMILFNSCQQKTSNDKLPDKKDSLSEKSTNEYAILWIDPPIGNYSVNLNIYYGNNRSEEFTVSKEAKKKDPLGINETVDAFNYMSKNGWDLKMVYTYGNSTNAIVFQKVK